MIEIPKNKNGNQSVTVDKERVDRAIKYILDNPQDYYALAPWKSYFTWIRYDQEAYDEALGGLSPADIREIASRFYDAGWHVYMMAEWNKNFARPVVISTYDDESLRSLRTELKIAYTMPGDIRW